MKSGRIKKYLKTWVKLKLFERKLEFWKLFENWNLKKWNLKKMKMGVLKIKFENWNFGKLFENGIFKN